MDTTFICDWPALCRRRCCYRTEEKRQLRYVRTLKKAGQGFQHSVSDLCDFVPQGQWMQATKARRWFMPVATFWLTAMQTLRLGHEGRIRTLLLTFPTPQSFMNAANVKGKATAHSCIAPISSRFLSWSIAGFHRLAGLRPRRTAGGRRFRTYDWWLCRWVGWNRQQPDPESRRFRE